MNIEQPNLTNLLEVSDKVQSARVKYEKDGDIEYCIKIEKGTTIEHNNGCLDQLTGFGKFSAGILAGIVIIAIFKLLIDIFSFVYE